MLTHTSFNEAVLLASPSLLGGWRLVDSDTGVWPLVAIALLLAYYLVVYRVVLASRPPGAIVPRYQPPDDASPAMLRFLERRTFDERAFAAAVLDLAARGYVEIRGGQSKPYVFSRVRDDDSMLPPDEIALVAALFQDSAVLQIDLGHREMIARVKKTMAQCMESLAEPYFLSSRGSVAGGLAFSFAALSALVMHTPLPGVVLFACAALAVFGSFMTMAWVSAVREIRHSLQQRSAFAVFMAITEANGIVAPFLLACFCGLIIVALARFLSITFGVFLLAAMVINVGAFCKPKVLSRRGRELLDEGGGFRQFLATAEADQLNRTSEGMSAPEAISKILPYALAFDLERRWASQRFAHAFGFAGGEYVSSKHTETGSILPQGTQLPNLLDLLSLASFLMEIDPQINDALARAGKSLY